MPQPAACVSIEPAPPRSPARTPVHTKPPRTRPHIAQPPPCPRHDTISSSHLSLFFVPLSRGMHLMIVPSQWRHLLDPRLTLISVRFEPGRPIYALAGYFRSGNSWTRHLLQRATGILTG